MEQDVGGSNPLGHPKGKIKFMNLSPVVEELINVFAEEKTPAKEGSKFAVSRTVSTLAVLYEKARNAVEFRAEHLVRRAAIERILKRRIMLDGKSGNIAENLVVELLWARYIDSSLIDEAKVSEIQKIINRYITLRHHLFQGNSHIGGISWDMVLGLASSEIDEVIVSPKKREALINFFYQAILGQIRVSGHDERYVNMQTYIAVERAYAQSDDALISFHLLKLIVPEWSSLEADQIPKQLAALTQNLQLISQSLHDPLGEPLQRFVRKHTAPYLLLRDFFFETGSKAGEIISDTVQLEQRLAQIAASRYQEIGAKVRRAVVRSIIYIFLTKMLFALALEAPFDIFITKRLAFLPLTINTLFPPVLLFLVAGLISVPGPENTQRLIERIKKILYQFDALKNETDIFLPKPQSRRPLLTAVFSFLYLLTFLISFGLISLFLTKLHFNIASQIIFVFFVTLVSFFAYRIRASAKEYEMVERQGFLEPLVDFFFLPILRAGHVLSREIARLNIFIFLFDFILEAPLKVIFEVAEEWIRFVRTKKEEII